MEPIPTFQRDFITESILRANPWKEGNENEKKMRVLSVGETITDYHILHFLLQWKNDRLWEPTFQLLEQKQEWEMEVNQWIKRYILPGMDMNWFWKECMRVWKAEHRERTDQQNMQEHVKQLQQIRQPEQRTAEWYDMRMNMITASDWASVLGMNPYSSIREVLEKKSNHNNSFTGNATTEWGVKYEPVAISIYEQRMDMEILPFGLLPHCNYSFLGASPDGITKEGRMLEIKCPPTRVIKGICPRYYWAQVQGQMECCQLERTDFMECKIEEYPEEEWIKIQYVSQTNTMNQRNAGWEFGILPVSKTGFMEKGMTCCIYEDMNATKCKYIHSFGNDELWKEQMNQTYPNMKITYWVLSHVSCIPIYRDEEWFHETALPKLACAWNGVRFWRAQAAHIQEVGNVILSSLQQISIPETSIIKKKSVVKNQISLFSLDDL